MTARQRQWMTARGLEPAIILQPATVGQAGAFALSLATFAVVASLPGCDADWIPCPCELPELGQC